VNLAELLSPIPFSFITALALVVLLLPLGSFLLLSLAGKKAPEKAAWLATTILGITALISFYIFSQTWGQNVFHSRFEWFNLLGGMMQYRFTVGILIDDIAAIMLVIVTLISFLVHLFSIEYMKGDEGYSRYFSFLGLFTFAMLGIILSDNLFLIFIFWELVGLSSFLLIGFWYYRESASKASKKAFLVNRVGDIGFLIGLMVLWSQFGTLDLTALKNLMASSRIGEAGWVSTFLSGNNLIQNTIDVRWLTIAGIGIFCGAIGKSAQFPLQVWLPDAMEGPTPVSALIHAATMVAAGVYLLARVFVLLNIDALTFIAFIGATTAFMGAFAAFSQNDIKKVLAFSTISQLGYMVMGVGTGAYDAAIFHLITHACFKACLFLSAGTVIHAMHEVDHGLKYEQKKVDFDVQDMRYMGGLRKKMPFTFMAYFIATMALAGLPLFSGFLSKDAILTGALAWGNVLSQEGNPVFYLVPLLGLLTAFMTAMYMGRQLIMVFFGNFRLEELFSEAQGATRYLHDAPVLMKIPLGVLAVLSLGVVFSINPINNLSSWVVQVITVPQRLTPDITLGLDIAPVLEQVSMQIHTGVGVMSVVIALSGLFTAWLVYKPQGTYMSRIFTTPPKKPYFSRLSANNWYLDEIYQQTIVKTGLVTAQLSAKFDNLVLDKIINLLAIGNVILSHIISWTDRIIIDGLVKLSAQVSGMVGKLTKSLQSGNIQTYFKWSLLGVILIIIWIVW
jgi:NADH-quinone oxidoreductase subunit L